MNTKNSSVLVELPESLVKRIEQLANESGKTFNEVLLILLTGV